jgi:hypothetical protein
MPFEVGYLNLLVMSRLAIGTTARTGQSCPESGVWRASSNGTTAPIAKGNTMPPAGGVATTWTLIQLA